MLICVMPFATAYGGSAGFVLPYTKQPVWENATTKGHNFMMVSNFIKPPEPYTYKITNPLFVVREVDVYANSYVRGAGLYITQKYIPDLQKEDIDNSYAGFDILTNLKESQLNHYSPTFRVEKDWLNLKNIDSIEILHRKHSSDETINGEEF